MNKFRFTINALATAIFMIAFASLAHGQASRTWVSGVGDDANPCSRTAPCKTFAGAISKTAAQGEINLIDNGGFGAVTINKSITIDGGYNQAGVVVSGTNAIVINAGVNDVVAIRHLDINGLGTGLIGVKIFQAKTVFVEHCLIYGFRATGGTNGRGISDERTQASPFPQLFVNDCYIRENVGGIGVSGLSAGTLRATIDNTRIQDNTSTGVFGSNNAALNIRGSQISGNLGDGVLINAGAQATIVGSLLTSNQGIAVNNSGGGQLSLADTTVTNNITGIGGAVTSFGNNNVRNNAGGNTLPPAVGQQ